MFVTLRANGVTVVHYHPANERLVKHLCDQRSLLPWCNRDVDVLPERLGRCLRPRIRALDGDSNRDLLSSRRFEADVDAVLPRLRDSRVTTDGGGHVRGTALAVADGVTDDVVEADIVALGL